MISSYEDDFDIGTLGSIESLETKYGKYDIDLLKGNFTLQGYEDEISVDELGGDIRKLQLSGKYLDADIEMGERNFRFSSQTKYGNIDYDGLTVDDDRVRIMKHIKESSELTLEIESKELGDDFIDIRIEGYEIKMNLY